MRGTSWLGALIAALAVGCGDDDGTTVRDAAASEPCTGDDGCSDAVFCNGAERCLPSDPGADARGCVAGTAVACLTGQSCSEEQDRCVTTDCTVGRDLDMDGVDAIECGGFDCDDSDRNRAPGNTEFCDVMAHDEDCDPMTFGVRDGDMDGFPDSACCNMDGETRICGRDCDDTRATANPTTAEACNGLDDDCDMSIDEGVLTLYTIDEDRDLHGSEAPGAMTMFACSMPAGYAERADDCDDMNSGRNPSVGERCDPVMPPATMSIDDDCDGLINEDCMCDSGTTRPCALPGRCSAGTETCVEGVWSDMCSIAPMTELCNGEDDDCSGAVDEGLTVDCYPDIDDDSFAVFGDPVSAQCRDSTRPARGFCPPFYTNRVPTLMTQDCVPDDARANPDASELCDGRDQDCSNGGGDELEEDADGDGHTARGYTRCAGGPFPIDDCQDTDPRVFFMQPAFFDAPACPPDRVACNECCSEGPCETECIAPSAWCLPSTAGGCAGAVRPASYDFDCNGEEEQEPAGSPCVVPAECGPGGAICLGGGAVIRGGAECGSRIEVQSCSCGGPDDGCLVSSERRGLRCR